MSVSTHPSYSWLAIRGAEPARVLDVLHLTEAPADDEAELAAAHIGDFMVVVAKRFDYADQTPLTELSAGGELLTCCVHEPLMYSSVSGWKDGKRVWYFVHDGGIGIQHMHIEGSPPAEFHAIANRLVVDQAEGEGIAITVDHVFEIAAQVAEAIAGFRYDEQSSETRDQWSAALRPLGERRE